MIIVVELHHLEIAIETAGLEKQGHAIDGDAASHGRIARNLHRNSLIVGAVARNIDGLTALIAIAIEQSRGIDQRSGDRRPIVRFDRRCGELVGEGKGGLCAIDQRPGDDNALKALAGPFDIGDRNLPMRAGLDRLDDLGLRKAVT